jgi:hypothetical protein
MTRMTRRASLQSVLAASNLVLCGGSEAATTKDHDTLHIFSDSIEVLKLEMSLAVKWWTTKYEGRTYHVCREELPFINVSRYNFHAWYQTSDDDRRLFHVWSCSTHGIGDIRLDIDEKAGLLTVVALERKLKDRTISTLYLGAAQP